MFLVLSGASYSLVLVAFEAISRLGAAPTLPPARTGDGDPTSLRPGEHAQGLHDHLAARRHDN